MQVHGETWQTEGHAHNSLTGELKSTQELGMKGARVESDGQMFKQGFYRTPAQHKSHQPRQQPSPEQRLQALAGLACRSGQMQRLRTRS